MGNLFSRKVTVFHGRPTPEEGTLAGYALLIQHIQQKTNRVAPLPAQLAIVTEKHQRYNTGLWQVFTKRHQPKETIISHLTFALKYEGLDLLILKMLFQCTGEKLVKDMVASEPIGQYSRRVWFLYEWLLQKKTDLPDLTTGNYVEIVNPKFQFPGTSVNSTRHRVKNNLPGTPEFCPLIRKTEKINVFQAKNFPDAIHRGIERRDKGLIRRAAAFLLLKDSKASFAIEGEFPPGLRATNWGKAIGRAGKNPLTIKELERLQDIVIGTKKLKHMGIRKQEGFVGEHDRETFLPVPDHISAKHQDLPSLMKGLIATNNLLQESEYDPILTATTVAFGFVFIHPFSDGNGRIHRYLIHHILAQKGYTNAGLIFPVSAAILERMADYEKVLEAFSRPRLGLIEWDATPDHNVRILNETADLYRYFDLTAQAEFLYECVENTIDEIIPNELNYLEKYDQMTKAINSIVTLSNTQVDLLVKILDQNKGQLSKNKRQKIFDELTDMEINKIEKHYTEIFLND